jgi:DNA-binding CsgD family transcriptional regulator
MLHDVRASRGSSLVLRGLPGSPDLTQQELQVANLVRRGLSNRAVAAQLFLSPRTIDFHLRNVFTKLGLSSRSELAALDMP